MAQEQIQDSTPATEIFPQFESELYDSIITEVQGLTDAELDFESDQWEWSKWSIRRNLSHMASGNFRWLWQRWGQQIFPNGLANGDELDDLCESPHDRLLNENKFWEIQTVLGKLRQSFDLCWSVLGEETAGSLRSKEIETASDAIWAQNPEIFPGGLRWEAGDSSKVYMNLNGTFRHRYYELTTHLFNIQRLKQAQGLESMVEVPFEGYWALPEWDRSQP